MERLLDRKEVQKLLTDMLSDFADYCTMHDLRFYLVGGTLLGAVRHKGFIPWDDDIDVGMPRPDYERFLDLVRKEKITEDYRVISAREGDFTLPFAEIYHRRTRVVRPTTEYINESDQVLHLVIDIFPQDGWGNDEKESSLIIKKAKRLRRWNKLSRARIGAGRTRLRAIVKIPAALLAKMIGSRRINRRLDAFAARYAYDSSKYVGAITYGIYGIGERCKREEVCAFSEVEFEGRKYPAPGCWDSYLNGIFGDYMTLPPKEEQTSHGISVWLSDEGETE